MNYTEKYRLPQWEESDRIMRTDFNQMCANLEEGIAQAQETADEKPYVYGFYDGNHDVQNIFLGFRPAFVIIFELYNPTTTAEGTAGTCTFAFNTGFGSIYIKDDSITIYGTNTTYPSVNWKGRRYAYIAFR